MLHTNSKVFENKLQEDKEVNIESDRKIVKYSRKIKLNIKNKLI